MIFPAPQPILTTSLTGGVLAKSVGPGGGLLSSADVQDDAALSGGFAERLEASEVRTKSAANSAVNTPGQADEADALARFPGSQLSSFDERTSPSLSGGKVLPQPGGDLPPQTSTLPIEAASDALSEFAPDAAELATQTGLSSAWQERGRSFEVDNTNPIAGSDGLRAKPIDDAPTEILLPPLASAARAPTLNAAPTDPAIANTLATASAPLSEIAPPESPPPLAEDLDEGALSEAVEPDRISLASERAETSSQTQGQPASVALLNDGQAFLGTPALDSPLGAEKALAPSISSTRPTAEAQGTGSKSLDASDVLASKSPSAIGDALKEARQASRGSSPSELPPGPSNQAALLRTDQAARANRSTERLASPVPTPESLASTPLASVPQAVASRDGRVSTVVPLANAPTGSAPSLATGSASASPSVTAAAFDPVAAALTGSTQTAPSVSPAKAKPVSATAAPAAVNPSPASSLVPPLAEAEPASASLPSLEPALASQSAPSPTAQTSAPLAAPLSVSSPTTPNAATAPFASASSAGSTTAEILEQVTQQVSEAREAGRSARPELTVRHSDFGTVAMRIEPGAAGAAGDWRATLSARDPGFVPAVQAALVERGVAATGESAFSQSGFSQGGFQGGSSQRGSDPNSQSSLLQSGAGFGAPNGGSDQRYGSSTGSDQGSAQPYPGEESTSGSSQTASVSGEDDAATATNGQGGSLFA
ncbi:MAG: hypothetical protein AAGH57_09765 [Pseudomonadota bacterium]